VDAERMSSGGFELAAVLVAPAQIVVGVVLMYYFIGIAFLAGIGVMIFTIVCTYFFQKRVYRYNEEVLKKKDERMKVTQEMLDIIRYIKINSIEKFFYNKVDDKRVQEVNFYKKRGLMDVFTIFLYWMACPLILSATFITYILLGNEMNSEVAFTTIMIFTTLQFPIRILPTSLSAVLQMVTSIKRIEKFLYAKEIKTEHVSEVRDESMQAVVIERGDFYYGAERD
jgi:ABC-type multidrug transport system fused ATPase/permease subunit